MKRSFLKIGLLIILVLGGGFYYAWGAANPTITAKVTSWPSSTVLYDKDKVNYLFNFQVSNLNLGQFVKVRIEWTSVPLLMECGRVYLLEKTIHTNGMTSLNFNCVINNFEGRTNVSLDNPDFQIKLGEQTIPLTSELHPYVVLAGVSPYDNESFSDFSSNTTLHIIPHPNRLLNGISQPDGQISPRPDRADLTIFDISITQESLVDSTGRLFTNGEFVSVYPQGTASPYNYEEVIEFIDCDDEDMDSCGLTEDPCPSTDLTCHSSSCRIRNYGEQNPHTFHEKVRFYGATNYPSRLKHLTELSSTPLSGKMELTLPAGSPDLVFNDNSFLKTQTYS
ncbi:MAG TPA: hypothetical protein PLQ36_03450, partial [Candidatus Gracilibacteria bacterium]|nr:hypothetical protein [Candidatus Gracilibacteria bacterium]